MRRREESTRSSSAGGRPAERRASFDDGMCGATGAARQTGLALDNPQQLLLCQTKSTSGQTRAFERINDPTSDHRRITTHQRLPIRERPVGGASSSRAADHGEGTRQRPPPACGAGMLHGADGVDDGEFLIFWVGSWFCWRTAVGRNAPAGSDAHRVCTSLMACSSRGRRRGSCSLRRRQEGRRSGWDSAEEVAGPP